MKMSLPSLTNIIKSLVIAIILSIISYFVFPYFNATALPAERLFAYAILAGAFIGAIIVSIPMEFKMPGSQQVSVFIGNLAFKASAQDLRELFSDFGEVQAVRVMTDRATRRPKGFAFVEMDKKGAKAAISNLDGTEFFGREIKVNYAMRRKS